MVNYELIGRRIRELRLQQKITQERLAELIDMSVPYVSYIETAKKKPSLETLIRISNALGITMDELLTGNQLHNPTDYQTDIDLLLAECSQNEKRLIFGLDHLWIPLHTLPHGVGHRIYVCFLFHELG